MYKKKPQNVKEDVKKLIDTPTGMEFDQFAASMSKIDRVF